jgi:hypothetical protein
MAKLSRRLKKPAPIGAFNGEIKMKTAQYQVVNAHGNILKFFGGDYAAAKMWAAAHQGCGLRYGLRVKKYFI